MLFNTLEYARFFLVAFVASWGLARFRGGQLRILVLLGLSYAFYASWNWRYLPLIFASSTVDFFLARAIAAQPSARRRKALLIATVVLNLGFLGYFKYWAFTLENLEALSRAFGGQGLSLRQAAEAVLPPVGVSFFTFESMSYVIDVYRGELPAYRSYPRYLLFVSFFPHLVAGPIVRPKDLLPQLERPAALTRGACGEALFLIASGLLKKVLLADLLAVNLVERVFQRPEAYSSLETLAGIYGYAVQIYGDFSGYSDIALGSALLLGVRFPANFDAPYQASNLAEFWRRWHISLSTWLRDYLYIPLGGSRGSELGTYRNLFLTMLLGGLWHGASWTFVVWGALHGVGLGVTRAYQRWSAARRPVGASGAGDSGWGRALGTLLTFHYVALAWVFFRAPSLGEAMRVLRRLREGSTFHPNLPAVVASVLGLGLLALAVPRPWVGSLRQRFSALPAPVQGALLFAVAVLLHEAASAEAVPFVYFQF